MSDANSFAGTIRVAPFRVAEELDGTGEFVTAPIDFAEQKVREYERYASMAEVEKQSIQAKGFRDRAGWWKKLNSLPATEARSIEATHFAMASEAITLLLARASVESPAAIKELKILLDRLLAGLFGLAGQWCEEAIYTLIESLGNASLEFDRQARHNPERFVPVTKQAMWIPGIISQFTEFTNSNAELVKLLKVGEEGSLRLPKGGKRGKALLLSTRVNRCAHRLMVYLQNTRRNLKWLSRIEPDRRCLYSHPDWYCPTWIQAAIELKPLSSATWPSWFEVAWEVLLDSTNGHPENEPSLLPIGKSALKKRPKYSKKISDQAKLSNVRDKIKTRLKDSFKELTESK